MMQSDPSLWIYMVDAGDKEAPRWSRKYTVTILASLRSDWVNQVWRNAEKQRITTDVDAELAASIEITPEFARLLTQFPSRPCK